MRPDDTFIKFDRYIRQMSRAELGGLLKEYVAESNHGSWEGFNSRDLTGIRRMFEDMMIYHASHTDQRSLATKLTNINPVP
jgi:hypothetical protein